MKKLKFFGLVLMICALCLVCTGCSTSLVENTETYFSTASSILKNLFSSGSQTGTDDDTSTAATDSDAFQYAFGECLVKVYAFPSISDSTHSMSTAATDTYTYSGEQSAPQLYYYWNTFDGTMGVQIANMDEYLYQAYPDQIDITFTNTSDSSDTITLTIEDVSADNYGVTTDALTRGETYALTAVATSTNSLVTNPTSDTTTVSEDLTLGDNHLYDHSTVVIN